MRNSVKLYLGIRSNPLEKAEELSVAEQIGARVVLLNPQDSLNDHLQYLKNLPIELDSIDTVIAWSDAGIIPASDLATYLNCLGPGIDASVTCRNKVKMKMALSAGGVPTPIFFVAHGYNKLSETLSKLPDGDFVIKAIGGSGGRGQVKTCKKTISEDSKKFTELASGGDISIWGSPQSDILVEAWAEGSLHSVSGIAQDGQPTIIAVTDKIISNTGMEVANIVPSRLSKELVEKFEKIATDACLSVGIRNGGFHVDIINSDNGPLVLEIGCRLGGECINSHLIPFAYRFSPYKALLNLYQQEPMPIRPPSPVARAAMVSFAAPREGRISYINIDNEALSTPELKKFIITKNPGSDITFPPRASGAYHVGHALLTSTLECDFEELIMKTLDAVRIEVKP